MDKDVADAHVGASVARAAPAFGDRAESSPVAQRCRRFSAPFVTIMTCGVSPSTSSMRTALQSH